MVDKNTKSNKANKIGLKRPSKSQRIHARRVKQEARNPGTIIRKA